MTWAKTWVDGEDVEKSEWVAMLDKFRQLAPEKVSQAGDLVYATAAQTLARLAAPRTAWPQQLRSDGSAPEWFTSATLETFDHDPTDSGSVTAEATWFTKTCGTTHSSASVQVFAWLTGSEQPSSAQDVAPVVKLQISLDNGATWDTGTTVNVCTPMYRTNSASHGSPYLVTNSRTGAATTVKVRARVSSSSGCYFVDGHLFVLVLEQA